MGYMTTDMLLCEHHFILSMHWDYALFMVLQAHVTACTCLAMSVELRRGVFARRKLAFLEYRESVFVAQWLVCTVER